MLEDKSHCDNVVVALFAAMELYMLEDKSLCDNIVVTFCCHGVAHAETQVLEPSKRERRYYVIAKYTAHHIARFPCVFQDRVKEFPICGVDV